jgi:hypothetical protein
LSGEESYGTLARLSEIKQGGTLTEREGPHLISVPTWCSRLYFVTILCKSICVHSIRFPSPWSFV